MLIIFLKHVQKRCVEVIFCINGNINALFKKLLGPGGGYIFSFCTKLLIGTNICTLYVYNIYIISKS